MSHKAKGASSREVTISGYERPSKHKNSKALPAEIEEKRTRIHLRADRVDNASGFDHHAVFSALGFDNAFDLDEFEKNLKIKINHINKEDGELVFELIGVDACIANALRRILISEVPTVAIEEVFIEMNTSIIPDEQLAHRIGLIPIKADPRVFEDRPTCNDSDGMSSVLNDLNTLVFNLDVKCEKNKKYDGTDIDLKYKHAKVYSGNLKWEPVGDQAEMNLGNPGPVQDDILLADLRPGQEISAKLYCKKGIGRDHAKFSPVCTASYRLMPEITFTEKVKGKAAKELVNRCPLNVFDIEDSGAVYVKQPRNCTLCRECIREGDAADKVKLNRIRDHFIFSIESVGVLPPEVLFEEAVKVFMHKIKTLRVALEELAGASKPKKTAAKSDDSMDVVE